VPQLTINQQPLTDVSVSALIPEIGQKTDLARLPIANNATFDSPAEEHNAQCHPDTRVDLLCQIIEWQARESPHFSRRGLVVRGPGMLGASFFFKRGERDRGNAALSIATQLVSKEPAMAPYVTNMMDADPSITGKA